MLVESLTIKTGIESGKANQSDGRDENEKNLPPVSFSATESDLFLVDDVSKKLTSIIGELIPGRSLHYFSYGNFNLVRLIMHILKQTGPVHVFMTSYSFSAKSIEQIINRLSRKELLSFKVIIDNRVKTMSPKPFQLLSTALDYRCTSIHAKVALLWNDNWKISIVTSQNATDNPKMERGTIFTDPAVFDFDHKALTHAFERGTT